MADDTVLTIIQSARRVLKLSQFEVADQLGIGRATYQRFEQGKSWLPIPKIQQLARILGVSPGVLGLADPQPYVAGDDLLRMWWGLFYSGRTDLLRPQLPTLLHFLKEHAHTPTPLLTRGYQIAVTLLRDQGDLVGAMEMADRAIEIAEALPGVDDRASALLARTRIPIDALAYTSDVNHATHLLAQARKDAELAAAQADRLTPVLRAVVLMNLADTRARTKAEQYDVQHPLTVALALAAQHKGTDERGYLLTTHGVLHIRARTGWYNGQPVGDALADGENALRLAQQAGGQGRWMLDMQITSAGLYVRAGRSTMAENIAASLVDAVREMRAARLTHRLRAVVEQLDDPHARRTLLAALNRQKM